MVVRCSIIVSNLWLITISTAFGGCHDAAQQDDSGTLGPSSGVGQTDEGGPGHSSTATTVSIPTTSTSTDPSWTSTTGDLSSSGESASGSTQSDESGGGCDEEELLCDGVCIDPRTDEQYCGALGDCSGVQSGQECTDGAFCRAGQCQLEGWDLPVELTDHNANSGDALGLNMARTQDGSLIAVWRQYDVGAVQPSAWSARYVAGVRRWTRPEQLEASGGDVERTPRIVIDSTGRATAVWPQVFDGRSRLLYSRLPSINANWSIPAALENMSVGDASGAWGLAADDDDHVHVTWVQSTAGLPTQSNYSSIFDPTVGVWDEPALIAGDSVSETFPPQMSVSSAGSAFVFWRNRDADGVSELRVRQRDERSPWASASVVMSLHPTRNMITSIESGVDPVGDLTVVWAIQWGTADQIRSELWWVRRTQSTGKWTLPARVVPSTAVDRSPTLHVDNAGTAHLVWIEDVESSMKIWHASVARNADAWSVPKQVAGGGARVTAALLSSDGSQNIRAVWSTSPDEASPAVVHSAELLRGASGWSHGLRLSPVGTESNYPQSLVVAPNGDAVVAWRQLEGVQDELWAIHYRSGRP